MVLKLPVKRALPALALLTLGCASPAETFERGDVVIHRITLSEGVGLSANAFLVESPRGRVLVDSGTEGSSAKLLSALVRLGVERAGDLDLLVVTHAHPDHAGGAKAVREAFGPFVAVHPGDLAWLESGQPDPPPIHEPEGHVADLLVDREADFPAVRADILLGDGQDLSSFGVPARVRHLPGHTRGTVAVVLEGGDAFMGDILRAEDDARHESDNAARTHPFGHDPQADRENVRALLADGVERFFVGHGGATDADQVREWLAEGE